MCAVSIATLCELVVSPLTITVCLSFAMPMYGSMIVSSLSDTLLSFFLILCWIRLCCCLAALSSNKPVELGGSSAGLELAENSAKLEYALLSSM